MKNTLIILLLLCVFITCVQAEEDQSEGSIKPGKLHRDISCDKFPNAHYHIYLPSTYTTEKKYPILILFSPGSNIHIKQYIPAAENLEWILVGAYESTHGPWDPILEYQKKIMTEFTGERYSVHQKRFYSGGMKAGARMATSMMFTYDDKFSGVLCITGIVGTNEHPVSGISVYGILGTGEQNIDSFYDEMHNYGKNKLESLGITYKVVDCDDVVNWPESHEHIEEAMKWFDLQYVKNSPKKTAAETITYIKERLTKAKGLGDTIDAYETYEFIVENFPRHPLKIQALKAMRKLQKKIKKELAVRSSYKKIVKAIEKYSDYSKLQGKYVNLLKKLHKTYPNTKYGKKAQEKAKEFTEAKSF